MSTQPPPRPGTAPDVMMTLVPAIVVAVLSFGLFAAGALLSWRSVSFTLTARETQGVVVGVETAGESPDPRRPGKLEYFPLVSFVDDAGREHVFKGDVSRGSGSGRWRGSGWREGQAITVRYNPANPDEARVAGGWIVMPFLLAGFGILGMFMARLIARSGQPAHRRRRSPP